MVSFVVITSAYIFLFKNLNYSEIFFFFKPYWLKSMAILLVATSSEVLERQTACISIYGPTALLTHVATWASQEAFWAWVCLLPKGRHNHAFLLLMRSWMDVNGFLKCEIHTDLGKYQLNSTNNVNKSKRENFSPYDKLFCCWFSCYLQV